MAEKEFQIHEDLLLRFYNLEVPPEARAKSQMITDGYRKTKETENLGIHISRFINRIKFFSILKRVIPVTMLLHIDDIVVTCVASSNLRPNLIQKKSN